MLLNLAATTILFPRPRKDLHRHPRKGARVDRATSRGRVSLGRTDPLTLPLLQRPTAARSAQELRRRAWAELRELQAASRRARSERTKAAATARELAAWGRIERIEALVERIAALRVRR